MNPIGISDHKKVIREEVTELLNYGACVNSALVNAILVAYQKALYRVLGKSAKAFTQLLISELGDLLASMLGPYMINAIDKALEDHDGTLSRVITKAFKELGLASEVNVIEIDDANGIEVFEIKNSVFEPAYRILSKENIEMALTPEAFLIASIIRTRLREHGSGNERVDVEAEYAEGKLLIKVKRISDLK